MGKLTTSDPLTFCKAMPPPLPLSAAFPMMRLALMVNSGPMPSLGANARCGTAIDVGCAPPQTGSASGAPMMINPPPLVGMVGLVLWLKRNVLCSMSPL